MNSITLRAYYMNADTQEIKLDCKGIVALPATYYPDQIGADLSVQRSLKERRSLVVEGLDSMPKIDCSQRTSSLRTTPPERFRRSVLMVWSIFAQVD